MAAVIVFVASAILHMMLPFHKSDHSQVSEEGKLLDVIRASGVTPGHIYHFPFCTLKDMKSAEKVERFKRGPVGLLTVIQSGPPAMGKYLGQWFVYCVVISIFVAYLTGRTRIAGAPYLEVFRVAGTVGFLGYAAAQIQNAIWKGEPWRITVKHVFDGLIYGLLTAGTFGWLWPK